MKRLIELKKLVGGKGLEPSDENQTVYYTTLLIEKSRGLRSTEIEKHLKKIELSENELDTVRHLMLSVAGDPLEPERLRATCVFVLGKFYDISLADFFRDLLRESVNTKQYDLLFQTIIALGNIGERIFTDGGGAVGENRKNLLDARHYLTKLGLL